jgi:hypothetical protein
MRSNWQRFNKVKAINIIGSKIWAELQAIAQLPGKISVAYWKMHTFLTIWNRSKLQAIAQLRGKISEAYWKMHTFLTSWNQFRKTPLINTQPIPGDILQKRANLEKLQQQLVSPPQLFTAADQLELQRLQAVTPTAIKFDRTPKVGKPEKTLGSTLSHSIITLDNKEKKAQFALSNLPLGVGSCTKVKLGQNIATKEMVAIKVGKGNKIFAEIIKLANLNEISALQRMGRFLGYIERPSSDGFPKHYMATPYYPGPTLLEYPTEKATVAEQVSIAIQSLKALKEIHAKNIVHGDLENPKNLIIESPEKVHIIDFTESYTCPLQPTTEEQSKFDSFAWGDLYNLGYKLDTVLWRNVNFNGASQHFRFWADNSKLSRKEISALADVHAVLIKIRKLIKIPNVGAHKEIDGFIGDFEKILARLSPGAVAVAPSPAAKAKP